MGHVFSSETDSEVVAHLLAEAYEGDFLTAVQRVVKKLKGTFALCILCRDFPECVVCVRQKSPLLVGENKTGRYAASDLPALAACRRLRALVFCFIFSPAF